MYPSVSKLVEGDMSKFCYTAGVIFLLLMLQMTTAAKAGDIMFPDQATLSALGKTTPKCKANGTEVLCQGVENYPANELESLIKSDATRYMELFGEDLLIGLSTRFDHPGEESLCRNSERLVYPQSGLNKDEKWLFIVNHDKYKQGIRIEECLGAGEQCSLTESFPNNYKTECRQHYVYRQLLSLSPQGRIVKEQFRFPASCKCVVKVPEM
ncbi:unnamed protein product [Hermetia illucens]|uniref:Spaetzle domain-containing protein n=2 Tax=Hermetia illucens TaxID=343691 RepID=A0A7R8V1M9_HERIL|nr:unnamed protein product [Hermetia illucens]